MSSMAGYHAGMDMTNTAGPWALLPATLTALHDALELLAHDGAAAVSALRIAEPERPRIQYAGSVAIIPLRGIITHRPSLLAWMFGGTDLVTFTALLDAALASSSVRSIVLDVDSPGGTVAGVTEAAARIREARDQKPVVAVANTVAASAAYWLAAQASDLRVAPSGEVGSVGIVVRHRDLSAHLKQIGERVTLISAGPRKVDANPFQPLSLPARRDMQAAVDAFHTMMVEDIARGRGIPAATVRRTFGEGRMVRAEQAVAAGMANRIATLDQTVARLRAQGGEGPRRAMSAAEWALS